MYQGKYLLLQHYWFSKKPINHDSVLYLHIYKYVDSINTDVLNKRMKLLKVMD